MANFKVHRTTTNLLMWILLSVACASADISITKGDTAFIPCEFGEGILRNLYWYYNDGTGPEKIITLFKGDLTKHPPYDDRADLQDDNTTLILKNISVKDQGTYRCDVDRQGQTAVPNINTNLKVFGLPPSSLPVVPRCTDNEEPCTVHANRSTNLTCELRHIFPLTGAKLNWYMNGQYVPSTIDSESQDDGTAVMIRPITVFETGNFTCNATYLSANGLENTAFPVDVQIISDGGTTGKGSGDVVTIVVVIVLVIFILVAVVILWRGTKGRRYKKVQVDDNDQAQQQATASSSPATMSGAANASGSDKREVTKLEITKLSQILPGEKYSQLCGILDFEFNYNQKVLKENFMGATAAYEILLNEWATKTGGSIEDLDAALQKAEVGGLIPKYKN